MEINEFEDIDRTKEVWKQATDSSVIKATTEDFEKYPSHVQAIIESEAKERGVFEKVIFLRGETTSEPKKANLEGYICEDCKGTYLNFANGRCVECKLPSNRMGYCLKCDKFWPSQPGQLCPEHDIKLRRHKAATELMRLGDYIFDAVILKILCFPVFFIIGIVLYFFVDPSSLEEINPVVEIFIGLSYVYLYYFIFESIFQRTPGKFITGTKVTTVDGTTPSIGTIAIRTLIRFVPFEALSFLGKKAYGWHDKWSGTYVVMSKRFKKKTIDHNQIVISNQSSSMIETPEKYAHILSILDKKVEKCENCGRVIGKLEQAYVFNEKIVCQQCKEDFKISKSH